MKRAWIAVPAILLFFFLAVSSVVDDSPTIDEQNHLARGLAFLRTGDPSLSLAHPPLINTLSALPLLSVPDIRLPPDQPRWHAPLGWFEFARQLLWTYNRDVSRMVFLSRLPIIFLTIGLALTGYHFAREIWSRSAAPWALLLLLFDPNILAHGRYNTTDVGGALFLLLAVFLLWRLWREPTWSWPGLFAASLALGLAIGSKLSAPAFLIILALPAVIPPLYDHPWQARYAIRSIVQLGLATGLALFVVWAIYGFQWGPYRFNYFTTLNRFSGPMPTFWQGIEHVLIISRGGRHAFLAGRHSFNGFSEYFFVAFFSKTPLPTLILLVLAVFYLLWHKDSCFPALCLLVPAAASFVLFSRAALNVGYRHLMPVLPLLLILISGLSMAPSQALLPTRSQRMVAASLPIGFLFLLGSDFWIHPHYLSFFNMAVGGPEHGYNLLIDSNIDWGQDLIRLKEWLDEHEVERIKLAWYGTAVPTYYGIDYEPLPGMPHHFELWTEPPFNVRAPEPGVYAISVSMLWELPMEQKYVYAWFRNREPDAKIGHSIFIYRVPAVSSS